MMKRVPNLTVTSAAKVHDNTKWPVWYGDGVKSLLSFIGALGGGSPAGVAAQRQASAGARDGVKGKGAISLRALRCMR
jgi:hypothetical protein